jgi:hypothetical protein
MTSLCETLPRERSRNYRNGATKTRTLIHLVGNIQSYKRTADKDSVALSHRQLLVIGSELRDLVFRLCTAIGAFLGLDWVLKHQPSQPQHVDVDHCRGLAGQVLCVSCGER